jgi:hypothetical protein
VAQRDARGVGSNQWRDRIVSKDDEERQAARKRVGDIVEPKHAASAESHTLGTVSVVEALSQHQTATDSHLTYAQNVPQESTPAEVKTRLASGVRQVAQAEDDILSRHPDLYGHALVSANNFLVRAKHDPLLRRAIAAGHSGAVRVKNACERLMRDAQEAGLDADGISQTISDLEGGGEWSAITTRDYEGSAAEATEDRDLCRRVAALSTAYSRSSDSGEQAALGRERDKAVTRLAGLRLNHLGE